MSDPKCCVYCGLPGVGPYGPFGPYWRCLVCEVLWPEADDPAMRRRLANAPMGLEHPWRYQRIDAAALADVALGKFD